MTNNRIADSDGKILDEKCTNCRILSGFNAMMKQEEELKDLYYDALHRLKLAEEHNMSLIRESKDDK